MSDYSVITVGENSAYDVVWRRLRKYHDEELSIQRLMNLHSIPKSQKENVRKQAQQISYSLTQAWEFSRAALNAGSSTKALLAYYSLTALANVEILWFGNGKVSFDQRNSKYNSHGFELIKDKRLLDFKAAPLITDGMLRGLYGLWRHSAKHMPFHGLVTTQFPTSSTETYRSLSSTDFLRDVDHPSNPISLADCFAHLPGLHQSIGDHGIDARLARGKISRKEIFDPDMTFLQSSTSIAVHPCGHSIRDQVIANFKFPPCRVPDVMIADTPSGALFTWNDKPPHSKQYISMPDAFPWAKSESYFVGSGAFLNEFGYFYIGLYITGMITRYHPQMWIRELRTMSHSSSLVDEFVEHSLSRVPLLTLCNLNEEVIVYA